MLNWSLHVGNYRTAKEPRFVMLNTGEQPRPFIVLDLKSGHTFLQTADQSIAEVFARDYNAAEGKLMRIWRWLRGRVNPPSPEQLAHLPDDGGHEWKERLERLQGMARERRMKAFNVESEPPTLAGGPPCESASNGCRIQADSSQASRRSLRRPARYGRRF